MFTETRVFYGQPFWLVAFSTIWKYHHHIFIMIFIFWAPLSMVQLIKIAQLEILFNLLSILHIFSYRNLFLHRNCHFFCLRITSLFIKNLHLYLMYCWNLICPPTWKFLLNRLKTEFNSIIKLFWLSSIIRSWPDVFVLKYSVFPTFSIFFLKFCDAISIFFFRTKPKSELLIRYVSTTKRNNTEAASFSE